MSFFEKKQRQATIIAELKSISSDSWFFKQCNPDDAQKSLVRGLALIAEAKQLGPTPEKAITCGLGFDDVFFKTDT